MAESEEELKNLLKKVKEESEKVGLKLNIQKMRIMEKARDFHKNIYFCFINYAKALDSVDHNKLESRLPGDISTTSDMQMTPPLW